MGEWSGVEGMRKGRREGDGENKNQRVQTKMECGREQGQRTDRIALMASSSSLYPFLWSFSAPQINSPPLTTMEFPLCQELWHSALKKQTSWF